MKPASTFGKAVKKRLIDLDKTQLWLIAEIREKTGLYVDTSYLGKLLTGELKTPGMIDAITEILDLDIEAAERDPAPRLGKLLVIEKELPGLLEEVCDDYCKFSAAGLELEELYKLCDKCPMNGIYERLEPRT